MTTAASKGRVLLAYSGGLGQCLQSLSESQTSSLRRRSVGVLRIRRAIDLIFGIVTDTSCILAWLIEEGYEVYAFMADVGQEEVRSGHMWSAQTILISFP